MSNLAQKNRISYIDIARGLGIICIVIGHSLKAGWLREYLYAFHVPLFFFLSGLTYRYSQDKKSFWIKKVRTIVVPYFFIGFLGVIAFRFLGQFASERLGSNIGTTDIIPNLLGLVFGNSKTGLMRNNLPLWFLPCLISVTILVDLVESLIHSMNLWDRTIARGGFIVIAIVIGVALTQLTKKIWLPWHMETAFNMVPFTMAGVIAKDRKPKRKRHVAPAPKWRYAVASVCLFGMGIYLTMVNRGASVREDNYHNYGLYLINAICGICGIYFLAKWIARNRLLEQLGRNTMTILLFHKFPILIFQTLVPGIKTWLKLPDTPRGVFAALITSAVSIALCLLAGSILKIWMPWSIGIVSPKERKNGNGK